MTEGGLSEMWTFIHQDPAVPAEVSFLRKRLILLRMMHDTLI